MATLILPIMKYGIPNLLVFTPFILKHFKQNSLKVIVTFFDKTLTHANPQEYHYK